MTRLLTAMAAIIVAGACSVGPQIHEFKPASTPNGVFMDVRLHGEIIGGKRLYGELLSARPDGLLLSVVPKDRPREVGKVMLVPYWMLDVIEPEQMGYVKVSSEGRNMDEERLKRLNAVARYPQGLSDELLAKLLAAVDQGEVEKPQRAPQ